MLAFPFLFWDAGATFRGNRFAGEYASNNVTNHGLCSWESIPHCDFFPEFPSLGGKVRGFHPQNPQNYNQN